MHAQLPMYIHACVRGAPIFTLVKAHLIRMCRPVCRGVQLIIIIWEGFGDQTRIWHEV